MEFTRLAKKMPRKDKLKWKRSISNMAGRQCLDKFWGDAKQFIRRQVGGKDTAMRCLNQRPWDYIYIYIPFNGERTTKVVSGRLRGSWHVRDQKRQAEQHFTGEQTVQVINAALTLCI